MSEATPPGDPGKTWLDAMNWGASQFPPSDVRHHELMSYLFWRLSQRFAMNAEEIRQRTKRARVSHIRSTR